MRRNGTETAGLRLGVKVCGMYRDQETRGIVLLSCHKLAAQHYTDVIMGAIASQITSLTIVYSTVYSDADQRRHQSSASLAFVWGIHRGAVNSRTNGQ